MSPDNATISPCAAVRGETPFCMKAPEFLQQHIHEQVLIFLPKCGSCTYNKQFITPQRPEV